MKENWKSRISDFEYAGDNSLKMHIFCVQNVKSSFAVIGLVNETTNVPRNHTYFFLLRNALSSANFRFAHLCPWLSAMTTQTHLASLKFAMKKLLFSVKFDQLWY